MTAKTNTKTAATKPTIPTDEQMRADGLDSLSSRIRHLEALGVVPAEIRKIVKRENGEHPLYQHVRNVLKTPLKKVAPVAPVASPAE